MLEIWQNLSAVVEMFKVGHAAWPLLCAGIIKVVLSALKSELPPVRKVVDVIVALYNRLPIADVTYHTAMNDAVWALATVLAILTYVTGGHSWSEAGIAFLGGGAGAFGVHETAERWLPKPVDKSGGQSSIGASPPL